MVSNKMESLLKALRLWFNSNISNHSTDVINSIDMILRESEKVTEDSLDKAINTLSSKHYLPLPKSTNNNQSGILDELKIQMIAKSIAEKWENYPLSNSLTKLICQEFTTAYDMQKGSL